VSASLLATDPTRSITHYLDQLAGERTRLAALRDPDDPALDVEAALALSYTALEPVAQAVLGQLSVFVADFDLAAAIPVFLAGKTGKD
jgi:predicted ATPase